MLKLPYPTLRTASRRWLRPTGDHPLTDMTITSRSNGLVHRTQHCSQPRGPRSPRSSGKFHESNEKSMAHRPHRRKEPPTRTLKVFKALPRHYRGTTALQAKHPPKLSSIANSKSDYHRRLTQTKTQQYCSETCKREPDRRPTNIPRPTPKPTTSKKVIKYFYFRNRPSRIPETTQSHVQSPILRKLKFSERNNHKNT